MIRHLTISCLLAMLTAATTCVAADAWQIVISDPYAATRQDENAVPQKAEEERRQESVLLDNEKARALLDYRLYEKVEAGMRLRLQRDAYDGAAWRLLAEALDGQGRAEEARRARMRALRYGSGERHWHISLKLGAWVDSNVVIAPDAVHLAARDQGDIGAGVSLSAYGSVLETSWGHGAWQLGWQDMLYQDFNNFALRRLQASFAMHADWRDDGDIRLGMRGEQAGLGGSSFYAGWAATAGIGGQVGKAVNFAVDGAYGRRNFASGFSDFSSWRWQVHHRLDWRVDTATAGLLLGVGREQTRLGFEAYRQLEGALHAGWRIRNGSDGAWWLRAGVSLMQRSYGQTDTRLFLKQPIRRKDNELKLSGALTWQRSSTLWGADVPETWQLLGGWMRNASNMDASAVVDPARSRDWRRWWSEVSVQWDY